MSRILLLALLSVCGASANAASKTTEWQPTNVQWHMSLDATGHITALGAEGAAVDALREKLEPVVRAWTFVPGAVNGKPAATETMLSVQVAFDSIAGTDDLSVRVVDVRTGGGLSPVGSKMPRFPRDALRRMMSGRNSPVERLVLSISYDASGTPLDISPIADASSKDKLLVNASLSAAKSWKIDPERVAGIGVAGTLVTPVCFYISTTKSEAERNSRRCDWSVPDSSAVLIQGQSLTLDSRVKLKSDVIGRTL